ncbi:Succinyl-CoA:(R)-benzylsuccinate CoA-transferase subunit BbsF [compost metagenome]
MDQLKDEQWPTGNLCLLQKQVLATLFATRSRDAWVDTFKGIDLPVGPVLDIAEALEAPQARHRHMLQHIEHPVEGLIPQLGFPVKYSMTPCSLRSPPPLLGEHNERVLGPLGYSSVQLEEWRRAQVI